MSDHDHTARLLSVLGDALHEAAAELLDGDERQAAALLRRVHDALRAAEPASTWDTLALVLEPHVAPLLPPAEVDDAWPFNECLDDLPDPEEDSPPPNLPFSFRKAN